MDIDRELLSIWEQATKTVRIVTVGKRKKGDRVRFRMGVGSVQGQCLTDVDGSAIALLTDKGNWYLLGEEKSAQEQSSNRVIEYRRINPIKEVGPPVIGVLVTFLYPLDANPADNPLSHPNIIVESRFCIATSIGKKIKIERLLQGGSAIWGFYVNYPDFFSAYPEIFLKNTYSVLGYQENLLKYLSFSSGGNYGSSTALSNYALARGDVTVIDTNKKKIIETVSIALQTTDKPFTLQGFGFPGGVIQDNKVGGYYLHEEALGLKYEDEDGSIRHVCISGMKDMRSSPNLHSGIIIWDVGNIDNLQSRANPACHFGFLWQFYEPITNIALGVGITWNGGYSVKDGIVLNLAVWESYFYNTYPFRYQFNAFIAKEYLKGENNTALLPTDLVFSKDLKIAIYPSNDYQIFQKGQIPAEPIEKRELFYPFKQVKSDAPLVVVRSHDKLVKRLMTFSFPRKDKKKKLFAPLG